MGKSSEKLRETSNSHYGKMDKGEIWRLIGRTGILACHLQQDR